MKRLATIAVFFALTGCAGAGGPSQSQLNSAMQKADQEAAVCKSLVKPTYSNRAQCQNAAYQTYVMPIYQNKAGMADFLAKNAEIAADLDERKITQPQAQAKIQRAMAELAQSEQNVNAAIQAQNAQEWRDYGAAMGAASRQVNQSAESNQANTSIKNTNCTKFGNQLSCTSW